MDGRRVVKKKKNGAIPVVVFIKPVEYIYIYTCSFIPLSSIINHKFLRAFSPVCPATCVPPSDRPVCFGPAGKQF